MTDPTSRDTSASPLPDADASAPEVPRVVITLPADRTEELAHPGAPRTRREARELAAATSGRRSRRAGAGTVAATATTAAARPRPSDLIPVDTAPKDRLRPVLWVGAVAAIIGGAALLGTDVIGTPSNAADAAAAAPSGYDVLGDGTADPFDEGSAPALLPQSDATSTSGTTGTTSTSSSSSRSTTSDAGKSTSSSSRTSGTSDRSPDGSSREAGRSGGASASTSASSRPRSSASRTTAATRPSPTTVASTPRPTTRTSPTTIRATTTPKPTTTPRPTATRTVTGPAEGTYTCTKIGDMYTIKVYTQGHWVTVTSPVCGNPLA